MLRFACTADEANAAVQVHHFKHCQISIAMDKLKETNIALHFLNSHHLYHGNMYNTLVIHSKKICGDGYFI